MRKLIAAGILALLLSLFFACCGQGQEMFLDEDADHVVIYFQSKAESEAQTDRFIWNVLEQRFGLSGESLWQSNEKIDQSIDFSTKKTATAIALSEVQTNKLSGAEKTTVVWMLMPSAADFKTNGKKLSDQMGTILGNENVYINLIQVGNNGVISDDTLITCNAFAKYPDRLHVVYVSDEWENPACVGENNETGNIMLSCACFAAFLHGEPVLLDVQMQEMTQEQTESPEAENEAENEALSEQYFFIPGAGKVLIISCMKKGEEEAVSLTADMGEQKVFALSDRQFCLWVTELEAGRYTLNDADKMEYVQVWYYPDWEQFTPVLNANEAWYRENQSISVSFPEGSAFAELMGDMDITLTVSPLANESTEENEETSQALTDEEASPDDSADLEDSEEQPIYGEFELTAENGYTHSLNAAEISGASVTARISWKSKNGCKPEKTWEDTQEYVVSEMPIALKDGIAQEEYILPFDSSAQDGKELEIQLSDLFEYNSNDYPAAWIGDHELKSGEDWTIGNVCISLDGSILKISVDWNAKGEEQEEAGDALTSDVKFTLALSGQEGNSASASITIQAVDYQTLLSQIKFEASEEPVKAGDAATWTVRIPGDAAEIWQKAAGIWPGINPLNELTAGESGKPGISFEKEEQGDWAAQSTYQVASDATDGDFISLALMVNAGDAQLTGSDVTISFANSKPTIQWTGSTSKEIVLQGMPWKLEKSGDLWGILFGETKLADLFEDSESAQLTYQLSLSGNALMSVGEEMIELPYPKELSDQSDFELSKPIYILGLQNLLAPKHSVIFTLTASDGVNRSDPIEITISVYSHLMRILSWIGLGLGAAALLTAILLVLRQVLKPRFADLRLVCIVTPQTEEVGSVPTGARWVELSGFGKKSVALTDLLIMTRQPPLPEDALAVAQKIRIAPYKNECVCLQCGKKEAREMGKSLRDAKQPHGCGESFIIAFCGTALTFWIE